MPGHIKLTKSGQPDPDPSEYLVPSNEMKRNDMNKPYDANKSVWIPDPKSGGFREGLLDSGDIDNPASKCVVGVAHEKFTHKGSEIGRVNPPKFENCEDMVNLTFLNDASVFWNLKTRYQAKMIHTYSGLFVVVVNPYKRYPIYTHRVAKVYLGKRRNEVPPHLWSIAETAYRGMLNTTKNQAILITGESGAGKTENTKKVITYLAMVASSGKKSENKVSLEDQIVATNPILESYGNAKTSRNDNSSRFGKFIRIHFNASGKLAGCDIVSYLLEKSRITEQQEVERSYHIFYQLLQEFGNGIGVGLKKQCQLSDDIYDYTYVSQGKTKVESIDDNEELEFTDDAFNVLGFESTEKFQCYMLTAAVMTFGEVRFSQKGRDEQAECSEVGKDSFACKAAVLCGVDVSSMIKAFCKPRIKVGTEWVTKGQNVEQATNAVGGIARAIYDRLFKWLIEKCNETLIDTTMKKANFCAVLDIAGFEIFDYNGFEQISINFVNEKLQQFFNHHMFIVEQETYLGEGIEWTMVDFGLDLQACIVMFEKPMGIWSILEEESLFPKATDKSFEEKLKASLGKLPIFQKPQSKTDKHAHFALSHYAGIVSYNVTGWLEKNKDPVNDSVVEVFKSTSATELLVHLWMDHPGQPVTAPKDDGKKKKKAGGGKTVSSVYLQSLTELMITLHNCEPHFVRCLVPNTHKKPGEVEPPLIMHQLTCNGVLEGIRICMRGFPNRILYNDFKTRYWILGKKEINSSSENKTAVYALMDKTTFSREIYRLGHTMVFFRAGAMAKLEEMRDDIVLKLIRMLQGEVLRNIRSPIINKRRDQRYLLHVCQRQFKNYLTMRYWGWYILIQKTKALIGLPNPEEELRLLEEKAKATYDVYMEKLETKKILEGENVIMEEENKTMLKQIEAEQGNISVYHEKHAKLSAQKADLENELSETQTKLSRKERERNDAISSKKAMDDKLNAVKNEVKDIENIIVKLEQEKGSRDHIVRGLNEEVEGLDEKINRINKEKKNLSETSSKAQDDLSNLSDKVDHLVAIKSKLEQNLDDIENAIALEKRHRANVEKERRKIEGELKSMQQTVLELERTNKELENRIVKKDRESAVYHDKLSNEQTTITKSIKDIKELQARVEDMEEEMEAERQARAKAEKQRSDLAREMDDLNERLNEAGGASTAQIELNKKRDSELAKLRKDSEECKVQNEATAVSLKKKHQDALAEMSEQMDQLNKMKSRIEKDKMQILVEISNIRTASEEVSRSKAAAEKNDKALINQFNALNKKIEEATLNLGDFEKSKQKIMYENENLIRQLQELEHSAFMHEKTKDSLVKALNEQNVMCDDESRERIMLLSKFRNLEHEYDGLKEHYDEEIMNMNTSSFQLKKALDDVEALKRKYEVEGVQKAEELEMSKLKLQARLAEAENVLSNLTNKQVQLEKSTEKLKEEINEISINLDQASVMNASMEKRAKQFDRIVTEWKAKVDGLSMDLNVSQKETRNASSELFRIKSAYEESVLQLDEVRRENKNLCNDIKDIMDQITDGGRSIHEIDKIRKRLEAEKLELESALSEAESALEQEENKVLRLELELHQLRLEIERRLKDKEEDFQETRKGFAKAIDSLQNVLESEIKSKVEVLRMKKRLESDVLELESSLEQSNLQNLENTKAIKKCQENIRQAQARLEDVSNAKSVAHEHFLSADRRAHAHQNALEESRTLLEQADRSRRQLETELEDLNQTLAEQTCHNQALTGAKRKMEDELNLLEHDLEEVKAEARMSEEKAVSLMVDAARLAEELRAEQELAQALERDNKLLEAMVKDGAVRLDEAEQNYLKLGKKAALRLESRIHELETATEAEKRRRAEAATRLRRSERRVVELFQQLDQDRTNQQRMQAMVEEQERKIKNYKKQVEEAEEIAAINLAKFKQTQAMMHESVERSGLQEQVLAKMKMKERAASVGLM